MMILLNKTVIYTLYLIVTALSDFSHLENKITIQILIFIVGILTYIIIP